MKTIETIAENCKGMVAKTNIKTAIERTKDYKKTNSRINMRKTRNTAVGVPDCVKTVISKFTDRW